MSEQEQNRYYPKREDRVSSTCVAPRPKPICNTSALASIKVVQAFHTSHGLLVPLAIAGHFTFPVEVLWWLRELWNRHFEVDLVAACATVWGLGAVLGKKKVVDGVGY
jgi:hypothetical protein